MLCVCVCPAVQAQDWEFAATGGTSGYLGDINPKNPFYFNDWTVGASVKYNFNPTWGLRLKGDFVNIWGSDHRARNSELRRERNLGFFNSISELSAVVDFNFFNFTPQTGRIVYTPYVYAGLGTIMHDPVYRGQDGRYTGAKLREIMTEGELYSRYAVVLPFGVGFKYNLRGPWTIGIEGGYRLTTTDFLDDVRGGYVDYDKFPVYNRYEEPIYPRYINPTNNELERLSQAEWQSIANPSGRPYLDVQGTQRGDGRPFDSYMTVGFTVSYTIFKGGCPEWR